VLFAMGPAAAGMYPLSLPDALPIFAVWTLYAGMRALLLLPYELQLAVGKRFGRVAWHAMRKRRRIADRNIEICMPELSAEERARSEEHTSELQSRENLVCRLLLEKK